jgi:hypothetical protein
MLLFFVLSRFVYPGPLLRVVAPLLFCYNHPPTVLLPPNPSIRMRWSFLVAIVMRDQAAISDKKSEFAPDAPLFWDAPIQDQYRL